MDTVEVLPQSQVPLLTIAIPTFNRCETLAGLLAALEPQAAQFPQVEVLVSDNCSTDETPRVVEEFRERFAGAGATLRSQRHAENIGADGNFASLYRAARGRFFWVCGDDDLIVPGGLAQVIPHLTAPHEPDILYATSYGFRSDPVAERIGDPLGRRFHTITSARTFARVVSIMFTFISGIIINRERLESLPHEDPSAFIGTNLVQLSWALPLLRTHRRSIVLWDRPVAARTGHAHGYALGKVFGEQLATTATRLLPGRRDLVAEILNPTIQRWFPSILIDVRSSGNTTLELDTAHRDLRRAFGGNFRYWLYTWPVLRLPLPLAGVWQKAGAVVCKALYAITVPGFWRKQT
jgi:abequosyltransferase